MYLLKKTLQNAPEALGTFVSEIKNPNLGYVLANAGFDHAILDNEHADFSDEQIAAMVAGARAAGLGVMVRIPEIGRAAVMKPLDSGADAILVPCVTNADQVRQVVEWAKFPPLGHRGCHPRRASNLFQAMGVPEYMAQANDGVMIFIQIETAEAFASLEEIAAVPGIAGLYVGPLDLSVALGVPGQVADPKVEAATAKVVAACQKNGLVAGKFTWDVASAKAARAAGVRLITYASDLFILGNAAAAAVAELKEN